MSGLENGRNLNYMVNITLGGQPIKVVIDTGRYLAVSGFIPHDMPTNICLISSDLYVSSTIATANDTGVHLEISYAIGEVSGKWIRTQPSMPRLNFFTL